MSGEEQDILSRELRRLEDELVKFKSVRETLEGAKEALELSGEKSDRLLAITREAIEAATRASNALVPLSKAIEAVNFPGRLDKIDLAVSTQSATTAMQHNSLERWLENLQRRQSTGTALLVANVVLSLALAVLIYMWGSPR